MKTKLNLRNFSSAQKRREFLEKELNIELKNTSNFSFAEDLAVGRNIENLIGATQIPLGVAGPLKIIAGAKQFSCYIPLATTEGALVASASRGCKAITESGGAKTQVEVVGASRGSLFTTSGIVQTQKVKTWIADNFEKIAKAAESTSSHLKLLRIEVNPVGKNLFLRFSYDTADAMGLNMITIANSAAAELLENKLGIKCISVAGNFDIDKKPAWLNFISGRGKKVWAEAVLNKTVVKSVLKTTPAQIAGVVYRKCQIGSAMSGSLGFNAHYSNAAAALFAATGQDLAHVVEASLGITTAEVLKNGDLYFSIYMPSLLCGTVGGGTHLPTQGEALKIMGIRGEGDSVKYAAITAGTVLAVEISLMASLAEGTLAKAHQKLGRKGK